MDSSISDEDSNPDVDIDSLKRDMRCMKYKLKKLKTVSKDLPVIAERGVDFALPSDIEEVRREAEDAENAVAALASEVAAIKKSAEEAKNAAEEAKAAMSSSISDEFFNFR
jgi:nucleoid-associated protein YgaU